MPLLDDLIKRFEKLELELTTILSEKISDFDEKTQNIVVKKSLKEYIKKVKKAKTLFDEYETLAKQIADESADDLPVLERQENIKDFSDVIFNKLSEKEDKKDNVGKKKVVKKSQVKKGEKESVNEF